MTTTPPVPSDALPPLPEPDVSWVDGEDQWGYDAYYHAHSADQMRAYATEAVRADLASVAPAWQPIETAPKDGTPVLLTDGDRVDEGWHDDTRGDWWEKGSCYTDYASRQLYPTGWMPLPPAPAA